MISCSIRSSGMRRREREVQLLLYLCGYFLYVSLFFLEVFFSHLIHLTFLPLLLFHIKCFFHVEYFARQFNENWNWCVQVTQWIRRLKLSSCYMPLNKFMQKRIKNVVYIFFLPCIRFFFLAFKIKNDRHYALEWKKNNNVKQYTPCIIFSNIYGCVNPRQQKNLEKWSGKKTIYSIHKSHSALHMPEAFIFSSKIIIFFLHIFNFVTRDAFWYGKQNRLWILAFFSIELLLNSHKNWTIRYFLLISEY